MREESRLGLSGKPGTRDLGDTSILGRSGSENDAAVERRLVRAVAPRRDIIVFAVKGRESTEGNLVSYTPRGSLLRTWAAIGSIEESCFSIYNSLSYMPAMQLVTCSGRGGSPAETSPTTRRAVTTWVEDVVSSGEHAVPCRVIARIINW